jgi:4-hydroxybenzoate polyprenyltransferase
VLMMTYKRTRHYGVFLLALTYAASAVLAVVLTHWWPLAAGFVLAWVLRFLGLDPDVRKEDGENSVKE